MTIAAFIEALDAAGLDLHCDGILDALWLCSLGRTLSVGSAASVVFVPPRLAQFTHSDGKHEGGLQTTDQQPSKHDETGAGKAEISRLDDDDDDTSKLFDHGAIGPEDKTRAAIGVLLPSARALPDRLKLVRALRPFRQPSLSPCAVELDEERTVELTAEIYGGDDNAIFPFVRPRYERRYEAHLLIEDDPAVELWTAPAREFAQLLRDAGAFRLIRSWRLRLDEKAPSNLAKAQLETPAGGLFSPTMLGQAGQLIFFLSPGRSRHWVDGTFARLIESWSAASVALLHLRPRDRWAGTALGEPQGLARALQPGSANPSLEVDPFWWRSGPDPAQPRVVKLPAIPLEAEALEQWARMQMGLGRQAETFLLDAADTLTVEEEALLAPEAIDPRRVLAELRETSEQAYNLAMLLANAPFTLPVAGLVQEITQNGSTDFSVLADLMLSGIVVPKSGQPATARENTFFTISETARPLLLRSLRSADADALITSLGERISRHLKDIGGRTESFSALIAHPGGIERLPEYARPFAYFLSALKDHGPPPTRTWQSDVADLGDAVIGRLARLAGTDVALSRRVVDPVLWPVVDNPRFISLSADGELRFLPNFAGYLRERLVAAPYLGLSILWVDDNPGNNVEIVPKLRYGGAAKVDLALTTKEALAHPDIRAYDLVLSDMSRHSDDRAGYTLLKRLREQDILAPVIFFAGYTMRSPARRAQAVAAGAFGATNSVEELLSLVDKAARAAVFRRALSEKLPAESMPALRTLGDIPPGEFCSLDEIYREVKASSRVRKAAILGSLLFYKSDRQQSWLLATSEQLVFILDDSDTREKRNLVQRVSALKAALPVSVKLDSKGLATVGFGSNKSRWYYSPTLFKTPDEIKKAAHVLLEKARPGISEESSARRGRSPRSSLGATTVYFASNRVLTGNPGELASYGPNIEPPTDLNGITYGTAFVGGTDVDANLQGTVMSIQNTKGGSFEQGVFDDLAQGGRDILVFLHGLDNTFSDSLTRAAFNREWLAQSGVGDLDTSVIVFSWPSVGRLVDFALLDADYRQDQGMARNSGLHLMTFIANLMPILLATRASGYRTFLLAHGIGNLALESAVENWFLHGNGNTKLFDHAILAAADCSSNALTLSNMTGLSALPHLTDRISVYYSGADAVLAISRGINLQHRLGENGPDDRDDSATFPEPQFRMVDASAYRDYDFNPIASHQYYRLSPSARASIAAALQG